MKATVTRTLQVPQFAPVVISLEKECSDDDYDATMDFLADAIENKLRERYPDFAIVLPRVKNSIPALPRFSSTDDEFFPTQELPVIQVTKVKPVAFIESMRNSKNMTELKTHWPAIEKQEEMEVYNEMKEKLT